MKNIGWIQTFSKKYGGTLYGEEVKKALQNSYTIEVFDMDAKFTNLNRYLKSVKSLSALMRIRGEKDLWIRDFYSCCTFSFDKTVGKNLVIIHHIDFSGFPLFSRPFLFLLEKIFFWRNLKKMDGIVVVSNYWKNFLEKKGYRNVFLVPNSINPDDFQFTKEEVEEFKQKHGLLGKPIIYLGNCQRIKGVIDAWKVLKNLDCHLVTAGRREVHLPALNLDLSRREHVLLLKASSIVLTMSRFKEGWCRTAHEAMLYATPVIGSGMGGMRELLESGNQVVCESFKDLRGYVERFLADDRLRQEIGRMGMQFAKKFTRESFENNWIQLVDKLI